MTLTLNHRQTVEKFIPTITAGTKINKNLPPVQVLLGLQGSQHVGAGSVLSPWDYQD